MMRTFFSLVLAVVLALAFIANANAAPALAGGPGISIVPHGFKWPLVSGGSAPTRVAGVFTRDTRVDITSAINTDAKAFGISPIGLTALLATESGINQYADRYGVWPDVSFGIAQFTVQTATGFHMCSDTASCRAVLDNPFVSIRQAALYLGQIQQKTCLQFPFLYSAYNQGPGYGCNAAIYYHPAAGWPAQALSAFETNYAYVSIVYGASDPPPAPVFNLRLYRAWCVGHHRPCPSPYVGHQLNWAASAWRYHQNQCRGVVDARYHPAVRTEGAGHTDTRFALCTIVTWARFHRVRITYHSLIP